MAHIVEFEIGRLAGRKGAYKKKLHRGLNVFFGLNGSGKTSLLRILHSAMRNDSDLLEGVPFEWARVVVHSITYQTDYVLTFNESASRVKPSKEKHRPASSRLKTEDATPDPSLPPTVRGKRKLQWLISGLPANVEARMKHIYLPTSRLSITHERGGAFLRHMPSQIVEAEHGWDRVFAARLERLWFEYSAELLSNVRSIQEEGLVDILQSILATKKKPKKTRRKSIELDPKTAYASVAAFLGRQRSSGSLGPSDAFEKRFNRDDRLREVVIDIDRVEKRIETAMASFEKLKQLIADLYTGEKEVILKATGIAVRTSDGRDIGLASLSSGEKHLLWIFIEALLVEENCLLIDEPELSLHIDWQSRLISAMHQLNSKAQFILATHSPSIVADLPERNIFKL